MNTAVMSTHIPSRRSRFWPNLLMVMFGIFVLILALDFILGMVIKWYANKELAKLPDYSGHVEDVKVRIWRGDYTFRGVHISKKAQKNNPLLALDELNFSLLWKPLLKGMVVASAHIEQLEVHLDYNSQQETAKEKKNDIYDDFQMLKNTLLGFVPLKIDVFEVEKAAVHLVQVDASPPIDLFITESHLIIKNLSNSAKLTDHLNSNLELNGKALGHAPIVITAELNPVSGRPTFDLKSKMTGLKVTHLNTLARHYGKFDFEEGNFDLVTEIKSKDGKMVGYVKPLFLNIKILSDKDRTRDNDSLLRRIWEGVVGTGEKILENNKRDQSGTRIPLQGDISAPQTQIWPVIVEMFKNAFIQALLPEYDSKFPEPQKVNPKKKIGKFGIGNPD